MFIINEDMSIYITRGDVAFFAVIAEKEDGKAFKFKAGDVIRFKVFEKKACENVVIQKDFGVESETEEIEIYLDKNDTKIGEVISKPVEYWYEVELNPFSEAQTIIGYDEDGAKVFMLYPEGDEMEPEDPVTPEDIPVVDEELDLVSTRPVQNQAVAREIVSVKENCNDSTAMLNQKIDTEVFGLNQRVSSLEDKWAIKPGESVKVHISTAGLLTADRSAVQFLVPLSRPVSGDVKEVIPTDIEGFILRQGGNYTHGTDFNQKSYAKAKNFVPNLYPDIGVQITANFDTSDTTFNYGTNNDPIAVWWDGILTFAD